MELKKNLDPQMFIFLSANSKKFRDKYFNRPQDLAKDFIISNEDLQRIEKIDFAKLASEMPTLDGEIRAMGPVFDSCYDSHSSSHDNDCSLELRSILDRTITNVMRVR